MTTETQYLESLKAELEQSKLFDGAIITLSGGAIALSIQFIKDLPNEPQSTGYLVVAWTMFALSIAVTMASFLTSQKSLRDQRDLNETNPDAPNLFAAYTIVLNTLSLMLLLGGMISFGSFAIKNIGKNPSTCPGETND